jgi:hypothetical protein
MHLTYHDEKHTTGSDRPALVITASMIEAGGDAIAEYGPVPEDPYTCFLAALCSAFQVAQIPYKFGDIEPFSLPRWLR